MAAQLTQTPSPLAQPAYSARSASASGWRWVIRNVITRRRYLLLVAIGVIIEIVVLSFYQIQANAGYKTFAGDLGTYNQVLYTTDFSGSPFHTTIGIPSGLSGQFLAIHFSPFLVIPAAAYAFDPNVGGLLIIRTVALALGAFPAYGLASARLRSERWGALFAFGYLLSPLTITADWNSFDPEVFLPLVILSAFYFFTTRRHYAFLAAWVLALAVIEAIAPLLLIFAVLALLGTVDWKKYVPSFLRRLAPSATPAQRRVLIAAIVVAFLWIGFAVAVLYSLSPLGGVFGDSYSRRFSVLGATSIPQVFTRIVFHPAAAYTALTFAGNQKIEYILLLVGSTGLLPIFGDRRYLLPAIAWMGLALFSNSNGFYTFGTQYQCYATPFLFAGAVGGAVAIMRPWSPQQATLGSGRFVPDASVGSARPTNALPRRWRAALAPGPSRTRMLEGAAVGAIFLVLIVTSSALTSPLNGEPVDLVEWNAYGIVPITNHDHFLDQVIAWLPAHASVLTTTKLFPHVSNRAAAYLLPYGELFGQSYNYTAVVDRLVNLSQFILVDIVADQLPAQLLYHFVNLTAFGLFAGADGAYLFERGWNGPPVLWEPFSKTVDPGEMNSFDSTQGPDPQSPSGAVLYHAPDNQSGARLWSGPNDPAIPPGVYRVTLIWKIQDARADPGTRLRTLEIPTQVSLVKTLFTRAGFHYSITVGPDHANSTQLNPALITIAHVPSQTAKITTTFNVTWPGDGYLSFAAATLSPNVSVWFYQLTLDEIAPPP
ncbi:MAG: DUF2079 domain-containing protein [Thermoplasmata archaeon]|nr:DUF2079 domain-containing protein [Thermoplasmata archaeon]